MSIVTWKAVRLMAHMLCPFEEKGSLKCGIPCLYIPPTAHYLSPYVAFAFPYQLFTSLCKGVAASIEN